jgi:hypothetical protein
MSPARLLLVLLAVAVVADACVRRTAVHIAAPGSLAGAEVLLDGRPVGRLEAVGNQGRVESAVLSLKVPLGPHELRVRQAGFEDIVLEKRYGARDGEDYIAIDEAQLRGDSRIDDAVHGGRPVAIKPLGQSTP